MIRVLLSFTADAPQPAYDECDQLHCKHQFLAQGPRIEMAPFACYGGLFVGYALHQF